MANHSRWCDANPKRAEYIETIKSIQRNVSNLHSPETKLKRAAGIKKAHADGRYAHVDHRTFLGKKHTEESKKKIRQGALNSNHRRLRKGIVEYNGIMLDSSWELALAKRLDQLGIKWTRPEPLKWIDKSGIYHNYFPDFYLPDYDLYLDPKNPHAAKVQKNKLIMLFSQYKNIRILHSLTECEEFNI